MRWETGEGGDSFYDDQWSLFSFTPRGVRLTRQASGTSADLAWHTTTGRRDVVIAILDSGIDWGERDLVNQYFLNHRELPEPQDAGENWTPGIYDQNGDGVFNIQDYAADPRGFDANQNGILDPGDLIAIFSDGLDGIGVAPRAALLEIRICDSFVVDANDHVDGRSSIQWQKINPKIPAKLHQ